MPDDKFCPDCKSSLCKSPRRVFFVALGTCPNSSTLCTCVCTAASLTAHDATTQPIQIRMCEFGINTESLDCVLSRRGALVTLRDSPEVHAVKKLLGVLSLQFEKLTFLCDSIGFPCNSSCSLHRSKFGIISRHTWVTSTN